MVGVVQNHRRPVLSLAVVGFAVVGSIWPLPLRADPVRISVFGLFSPTELHVRSEGPGRMLLRSLGGSARIEGRDTVTCRLAADRVQCVVGHRQIEGDTVEIDSEDPGGSLLLSVPDRITRRYRGELLLIADRETLRAVVAMEKEIAVASIVAAESPPKATLEALQAQAVAARSYLMAGARHDGFDFCDTTHCQFLRAPAAGEHPASRAAAATAGVVLRHRRQVLRALYSRSCGGTTRTLRDTGLSPEGYPYFRVSCDACLRDPEKWQSEFQREQVQAFLDQPTEAMRLELARRFGWSRLPSSRFRSDAENDAVTLHGKGIGHGIGLCQRGSAAMAADGVGFAEILQHYFPNTTLGR